MRKYFYGGIGILMLVGLAASALGLDKPQDGTYCEWSERYGRATTMYGDIVTYRDGEVVSRQRDACLPD